MSLSAPNDSRVTHHYADVGEVLLHYVTAGEGPPVVLIHGYPQTWWEWRHQIPVLAEKYTVIAPDMRGLGDSSRPATGYDKKTIANDIWQVVNGTLGHESFYLVGHDWGGPTAYALAAAHPDAVKRLVIIDVPIPGCGGDFSQGGRRWHHQFHMTLDLPEALTAGTRGYLPCLVLSHLRLPARCHRCGGPRRVRTYLFSARRDAGWLQSLSRRGAGRGRQSG